MNASVKFGKHNVIHEIDKKMNKMNKIVRIVLYSEWLVYCNERYCLDLKICLPHPQFTPEAYAELLQSVRTDAWK